MNKTVIIVAAGSGRRMQSQVPKQFILLADKPVLMWTMEKFHSYDPTIQIILVLPEKQIKIWTGLCKSYHFMIKHEIIKGGQARFHSVFNGLQKAKKGSLIAVHDGVRPAVSLQTIKHTFLLASQKGNAIPAIIPADSIRIENGDQTQILDRKKIRIIQTPQVFQYEQLIRSYNQPYHETFTDDSSVVEFAGFQIHLTEGNPENIKITTPMDLKIAEIHILNEKKIP